MSSDMINLARKVAANYNLKPKSVEVVQGGGIKTVWKIGTDHGTLCLKRLRQPVEKASFSINAQNYMALKGVKVPAIIPAKGNKLFVLLDDQLFVMYQWVTGRDLNFEKMSDLEQGLYGIAEFHRGSAGYLPPENCRISSKLGRWPHYYDSVLERLRVWKKAAGATAAKPVSRVFLANVDHFINLGQKAVMLLASSPYNEWVKQVDRQKNLCHQDYGTGNAVLTPKGVYVIDLDGVTYDLPARDLRKIINKCMENAGRWDVNLLQKIVGWYVRVNPLTPNQLRVLYLDLLFPHIFHDTAKNPFHKNQPIDPTKLAKSVRLELLKEKVLAPLIGRI